MESSCECGNGPSGYKIPGNYRATTQLMASQVVLSSIELVRLELLTVKN
jgi:hypothetical protein